MTARFPVRLLAALTLAASILPSWIEAQEGLERPRERIVVGSKMFAENRLLAEMMAQLIEAETGIEVERRLGLGGTQIVFTALREGEIDLYPEYTGTGLVILLGDETRAGGSLETYVRVQRAFARELGLTWGAPFGFANSYALTMLESRAEELGIETISDLVAHGAELRAGVSHEFLKRSDGFPGLAAVYGLEIGDVRGLEHALIYDALRSDRVDLVDTYTTDGKLLRYDVRILEDDRGFFPPYDAAPLVRSETLERLPELGPLLDRLGFLIDDERMRELNARVEEGDEEIASVARAFLREEGLLTGVEGAEERTAKKRAIDLPMIGTRVVQHLALTAAAVLLAVLVAVPLGIALTRRESLAGWVLGATGIVQTIPSLALLAFMIPIPGLGLGARSAIAALFLYALLPIVRNTYTGIKEIDPELREAAIGIGLTDRQLLTRIELPLATRTIMAGVRTAAVISIGVATLAAFVGAGGLGDPIITGLQLNDTTLVLSGAVPAALLAIVADRVLDRFERWLAPRDRLV